MNDEQQTEPALSRTPLVTAPEQAFLLEGYRAAMGDTASLDPRLGGALRDTLAAAGSLARAQLAFSLAKGGPGGPYAARDLAVALEYFHTASLLFDDLPCMDNAAERRGRTCPHVTHGEAPAILAALALITRAYGLLWQVLARLPLRRRLRASALTQECLGASGILDGQARDLAFVPGSDPEEVARVARGKTVTLIRLTLLLPALVRGHGAAVQRRLERLAEAWGLAYQTIDDFKDRFCITRESGKTSGSDARLGRPNLVAACGPGEARRKLERHLAAARALVDGLRSLRAPALDHLQSLLEREAARLCGRPAVAA